jgi:hypothetical protein
VELSGHRRIGAIDRRKKPAMFSIQLRGRRPSALSARNPRLSRPERLCIALLALLSPLAAASGAMAAAATPAELFAAVPALPSRSAEAARWFSGDTLVLPAAQSVEAGIAAGRAQIEAQLKAAGDRSNAVAGNAAGIDMARMASDPAYAESVQARMAAMSPQEQMAMAMQLNNAFSGAALQDAQAMARDPQAVIDAESDFTGNQPALHSANELAGVTARIAAIRDSVSAREQSLVQTLRWRCSDGEGGCPTPADAAADQAMARQAHAEVIGYYDAGLAQIGKEIAAFRRTRGAYVQRADQQLAATHYGADAVSQARKQSLALYQSSVLDESQQLLKLTTEAARWAAARASNRMVAFRSID